MKTITITNDITYHEAKKRLERLINNSIDATSLFRNFDVEDDTGFENYINSLMIDVTINYHISKEDLKESIGEFNPNLKRQITTQSYEDFRTFYDTAFGINNFVGI